MNAEAYRHQLADCADHLSAAIARAALLGDPLELELLAIRLDGTRMLAMHLRNAILAAPASARTPRSDSLAQAAP